MAPYREPISTLRINRGNALLMKKLIDNPRTVVREMLEGLTAQNPELALLEDETVVVRHGLPPSNQRAVAVISGGGSGHEPAHGGYVGAGMLTAAVAGDVFTSPSTDAVLAAIRAVAGPAGAVLIVKNYTGDRLNFGLAAEMARTEGIPVEVVVVADDVALNSTVPKGRRRGIAGTIFVHKVAGASAARGDDLETVARYARAASDVIGSMGVALGACTLPTVGKPGFQLADDEIEMGLGIHGEAGVEKSTMRPAAELVAILIETIANDLGLSSGDELALLVNGLGATPPMELSVVARDAMIELKRRGMKVSRAWTGTFLSALDMPGCSLSLFKLTPNLLALLDAPTNAISWPRGGAVSTTGGITIASVSAPPLAQDPAGNDLPALRNAVQSAARALVEAEPILTELDTRAGDGDLGSSLERGSQALLSFPDTFWRQDSASVLQAMGEALRRSIGGSSGPFYATALIRAARRVAGIAAPSPTDVAEAFDLATQAISTLGGATSGDRTMLDALIPASNALRKAAEAGESIHVALKFAAQAAAEGAEATASMKPRLGRASYLGERTAGIPDGGAKAVAIWLNAVASAKP
jgi:ATP-dependent dihydroxyacetone kinase